MKILAIHLQNIMDYAAIRGVTRQLMLKQIKHPPADFKNETAAVEPDDYYAVLDVINKSLKDELAGIRAANYLNMKLLGLIYQISLQCTTIEEALFYLKTYLNATFPIINMNTHISGSRTTILPEISNEWHHLNRIILENTLTVMARELKVMAGEEIRIHLFSPFYTDNYPNVWSYADSYSIQFRSEILKATMKDKSRLHLEILVPEFLKLIETLKAKESFSAKVKIASLNLATPELPDLKTVADSFKLTPRTLQRRLQIEETNFRQIIGELKQKISELLLLHDRYSVADISYALGYSEPAAFIHSFKKWHGDPPQKIRKDLGRVNS